MTTRLGILSYFQGTLSILCIAPLKTLFIHTRLNSQYIPLLIMDCPFSTESRRHAPVSRWAQVVGEKIRAEKKYYSGTYLILTVDNIVLWSDPLIQDWYHELVLHTLSFCRWTTALIYTADSAMATRVPCTHSISIDIITTMISTRPLGFDIHSSHYTSTLCFIQMEVCTHWSKPSYSLRASPTNNTGTAWRKN